MLIIFIFLRYGETALAREKVQDTTKIEKNAMLAVMGHANNSQDNYFQGHINILIVMTYQWMFNYGQSPQNPFIEFSLKSSSKICQAYFKEDLAFTRLTFPLGRNQGWFGWFGRTP